MADLSLAQLKELLSYDPETGLFVWRVSRGRRHITGTVAGHITPEGYLNIVLYYRQYKAHRLAWLYVHGVWPPNQIDHVNLDRSDNRLTNLRLATQSQNKINSTRQKNNTSGFKGVRPHNRNGTWHARIGVSGNRISLGYYPTASKAHDAYMSAARKIYGEFARSE